MWVPLLWKQGGNINTLHDVRAVAGETIVIWVPLLWKQGRCGCRCYGNNRNMGAVARETVVIWVPFVGKQ